MTKIGKQQLISAAAEITEAFKLKPPIDTKVDEDAIVEQIKEALTFTKSADEFTDETITALNHYLGDEREYYEDKKNEDDKAVLPILTDLGILDEPEDEPEEEETEDDEPAEETAPDDEPTLLEQIEGAERLKDLKEIAKDNDEFKPLRGKLNGYKTADELQDDMLDILEEVDEVEKVQEDERKHPEPVEKKTEREKPAKAEKKETPVELSGNIKLMKVSEIKPRAPFNSIFETNEVIINSVKAHMEENGYDKAFPIILWNETIIDGHTRFKVAKMLGIDNVPVLQKEFISEQEALEYAIHNQRDRRNLTEVELLRLVEILDKKMTKSEAGSIKKKTGSGITSHEQTAKSIGVGKSKVSDARTVLDDKIARKQVEAGKKSISAAAKETRKRRKVQKPNESQKITEEKTRIECVVEILKDYAGTKVKIFDITDEANDLYKNSGGKSNLYESAKVTEIVISVLKAMNWIESISTEEIRISEL